MGTGHLVLGIPSHRYPVSNILLEAGLAQADVDAWVFQAEHVFAGDESVRVVREEPDAVVPHVRVCGEGRRVTGAFPRNASPRFYDYKTLSQETWSSEEGIEPWAWVRK